MVEEILPNLFRIEVPLPKNPLRSINSYVIISEERNLIIDTGFNRSECRQALEGGLDELGVDLEKTDFFITHLHADHSGLVTELAGSTSKIYFNRIDARIIQTWRNWDDMIEYAGRSGFPKDQLERALKSHPGVKYSPNKIPEFSYVGQGDVIEIGDFRFVCIETPGHSKGHTCLFDAGRRLFISGDHVLSDITPNIQCWSDQDNHLKQYLASLDKVYDLEVNLVLPGHRNRFSDLKKRIDELKEHHRRRTDEVLSVLDGGGMNAFQVASKMSWDIDIDEWEMFPIAQKWFATGETIAHLRFLEDEGMITRVSGQELITYIA
ncbi:MAG: MBL fold metallo-hydrolase [Deltaproteobacteria bacterium]|nr:MBL fold metallo-hydrolase [Deltaproteobacteria bacterium]